ncbi:MAG: alpha-2-macroglobulin family protein [Bacteroidota bacterium]|nr:alpha-2-macroglobulin family protein [Bacteroidota bacterium]
MLIKNLPAILCLCLIPALLHAQRGRTDYDAKWKIVDSLAGKKGLTRSALARVNKLYAIAKEEKNEGQSLKALIYRMGLRDQLGEDSIQRDVRELGTEIANTDEPARSILKSMLADVYLNYLRQHSWQLRERTRTVNFRKADIESWGTDDFQREIDHCLLGSLKEDKLLFQTSVKPLDPIIIKGNAHNLRPTLYDLLATRALNYFTNAEQYGSRPEFAFEMDDPMVYAVAEAFTGHPFQTRDPQSPHYQALRLYQALTRIHLGDSHPDALVDLEIERLKFVHAYSVMPDKDSLYMRALGEITSRYGDLSAAAEAWYLQAQQYANLAEQYNPLGDTTNRYAYLKVVGICEKVTAEKDSSEGKSGCRRLLVSALAKELKLETEKVNSPGLPFRALLTWRNISRLHFRLISLDHNLRVEWEDKLSHDENAAWKQILGQPSMRAYSQNLPETGDHQEHRMEIRIDALPVGEYALIASVDENFGLNKNLLAAQLLYVSSIAYVNYGLNYFVLDRETGQPVAGAKIKDWFRHSGKDSKDKMDTPATYRTDEHGYFRLKRKINNRDGRMHMLEISTQNDHLFLNEASGNYRYDGDKPDDQEPADDAKFEREQRRAFLFTDRSIYRPGQTLYFKGIVTTRHPADMRPEALPGSRSRVVLYNANSEPIDSAEVTSNEFGSYQGKFLLPDRGVTGVFSIRNDSGKAYLGFSVEEYKRPTFYVEYQHLQGSPRLGDSIRISGAARAYSGSMIGGALVRFNVTRQARFPYAARSWRGEYPSSRAQQITHGEVRTGQDGTFSIPFIALPDRSIVKEQHPVFEFLLSADVTDISGETRSQTTTVAIGYQALELSIQLPQGGHLPADSMQRISVSSTNLSGEAESSIVHTRIFGLRSPDRLIRDRYWQEPDQFSMSRQEWLTFFPRDEYDHEKKKESWGRARMVFESSDSSEKEQNFHLKRGWYVIEATANDRYGQEVKDVAYIDLYDQMTGEPASPAYIWDMPAAETKDPGKEIRVPAGSSATNLFVIRKADKPAEDSFRFIALDQGSKTMLIPHFKSTECWMTLSDIFVKDNRVHIKTNPIWIAPNKKELDVHVTSFRDKTLPGSDETWALQVTGEKKERVNAEILTSMYDSSLDQFSVQRWAMPEFCPYYGVRSEWEQSNFAEVNATEWAPDEDEQPYFSKEYDELLRPSLIVEERLAPRRVIRGGSWRGTNFYVSENNAGPKMSLAAKFSSDADSTKVLSGDLFVHAVPEKRLKIPADGQARLEDLAKPPARVQVRKNLQETAFFLPDLHTDSAGNVSFRFTMPEGLTTWKWMTLAHTKDLAFGYAERSVITQKSLMVQPNAPRFLREGDRMELMTKIVNLTDSEMTGQAELRLTDPTTGQSADGWFTNRQANQFFTVGARQSITVSWPIEIPFQYNRPLTYRITASAGNYGDGEEAVLPVVSNRMLVTESLPLNMISAPGGAGQDRHFVFDKLLQSGGSETLSQHALTVEFTSNPAWYAVQALPFLMEYPYECAEQTFNRFYANALASHIVNGSPKIRAVFEKWKTADTATLLSNLEKNQELKSVLLEETPWVFEARSESQQKKNIALLFDMIRMQRELGAALDKLKDLQSSDGGFPWFKDGPVDRYITQYVVTGIGRLIKLNALPEDLAKKATQIAEAGLHYADERIKQDYAELKQQLKRGPVSAYPVSEVIQYLYMRSFFPDFGIRGDIFPAVNEYRKRVGRSWLKVNRQLQGMVALALYRTGDVRTAKEIVASLKENAISDNEQGMYWKQTGNAFYWDDAPIETQSLLIEVFREISPDGTIDSKLKTWLLRQKQTQSWATTKATADACYALLTGGGDWLNAEPEVTIRLGEKTISSSGGEEAGKANGVEVGTGYFKKVFDGPFVHPSMGNITLSMTGGPAGARPAWGAVYWQYFENLDKIVPPDGQVAPLRLSKKLFIEKNSDKGQVLEPVEANGTLKPGDKVVVRIELRSDRDLEYVHMKDMRGACMEPLDVMSGYKWQGGLGYYESTKDASTDFFFDRLPKGVFVFEYAVFVGQAGNFSNGVTSIECMYAPEFAFHSEGIRVNVERP